MKKNDRHLSGFVSIIGKPNVGKSTLMNVLVDEKLSVITSKAQTTRHRIMGIINGENYQIVYSDTPGILSPKYQLQQQMMKFVYSSLVDADIILFIADPFDDFKDQEHILNQLKKSKIPIILILNKIDLKSEGEVNMLLNKWKELVTSALVYLPVSALLKTGVDMIIKNVIENLPEHPPYFPLDQLTDKPKRFFATEILREKIFLNYKQEVPYACEVEVEKFKDEESIIRISVLIYVERRSQKSIIIGKGGVMLKKIGTEARIDLEAFFGKKIFLEMYVKVATDWRKKQHFLKKFGYSQ